MGSSTTKTTTGGTDPWQPAQGYINDIMQESKRLYDNKYGANYWKGGSLGGLSDETNEGLSMLTNTARKQSGGMGDLWDYGAGGVTSGGYTSQMNDPSNVLSGISSGSNRIRTGSDYNALKNRALYQNQDTNNVFSDFMNRDAITTGGQYGDLYQKAGDNNRDVMNTSGKIMSGGNRITAGDDLGALYNRTQGQNNDVIEMLRQYAQKGMGPTHAETYLTEMAKGNGDKVNPYIQSMLDSQAGKIASNVNSRMAGMGRGGSGGHTDLMTKSLTDASMPVLAQAFSDDQNRRLQATGLMDQSRLGYNASGMEAARGMAGIRQGDTQIGAGILGQKGGFENQNILNQLTAGGQLGDLRNQNWANQFNTTNSLSGIQGQNAATRLGAAGSLADSRRGDWTNAFNALGGQTGVQGQNIQNQYNASQGLLNQANQAQNASQGWASLLPMLNELQYDSANRMGGVGSFYDQRNQTALNDQRSQFDAENNQGWSQLSKYLGGVGGLSGLLQGKGQTSGQEGSEQPMNWATMAPMLMMLMSDRDTKTDIKKVGKDTETGLNMYAYRYKGDPKTYPKVVGPMADEMEEAYPGTTRMVAGKQAVLPSGFGLLGSSNRVAGLLGGA